MIKEAEFVSSKRGSLAVVKVEIPPVILHCKCGKKSEVHFDHSTEYGYYDGVEIFLEVECPHCHERFEKSAIYVY